MVYTTKEAIAKLPDYFKSTTAMTNNLPRSAES